MEQPVQKENNNTIKNVNIITAGDKIDSLTKSIIAANTKLKQISGSEDVVIKTLGTVKNKNKKGN